MSPLRNRSINHSQTVWFSALQEEEQVDPATLRVLVAGRIFFFRAVEMNGANGVYTGKSYFFGQIDLIFGFLKIGNAYRILP